MSGRPTVLLAVACWGLTAGLAQALTTVGPETRIETQDNQANLVSIAYGDGVYAIAYCSGVSTDVWVEFVDPNTLQILGQYEVTIPSGSPRPYGDVLSYGATYNPVDSEFGVIWAGHLPTGDWEWDIYFRPIKKDGTCRIAEVALTNYPGWSCQATGFVWDSLVGKYVLSWTDSYPSVPAGPPQIRVMTFDRNGINRSESAPFGGGGSYGPDVAVGPNGYAVLFERSESLYQVYFAYLDRNLNLVTSPRNMTDPSHATVGPRITYGDGGFAALWKIWGSPCQLYYAHLDTSGSGTPIVLVSATDLYPVTLLWDGTRFLTTWNDARPSNDNNWYIYGVTHDKSGAKYGSEARIQESPSYPPSGGAVARSPGDYFMVWQYGYEIRSRRAVDDITPPGPVTSFTATAGEAQITLAWTNPSTADFTGTLIRYKTTGYPTSVTDGTLVVNKANTPGSNDSYVHTGLTYGVTYYYAAFAHDLSNNYSSAMTAHASPLDTTQPGPITSFTATPSNGRVTLAWVNPSDADFKGTWIRYKTTGFPTGPTDGILLVDKSNTPGTSDSYAHNGLTNGVMYYYSAFAHDAKPNYATAATASAKPFIAGDFDLDGDVDQQDFGHFQACLSGPGTPYAAGCADADWDGDGNVDTDDLSVFLNCMGSANQPPGC